MVYFTYVIYSEKFERIYIGHTSDIDNRLIEHNSGITKTTKNYGPWKLVYSEKYELRAEAMKREKQLKTSRGRSYIWKEIIGIKKN